MTVAVFFGCTFIAFGPAVSLFLFTIARDPLRVIFLIAGYVSRQEPGHKGLQVQSRDTALNLAWERPFTSVFWMRFTS